MAPAGAFSSVATWRTRVPASPRTLPPKRRAMSRSVWPRGAPFLCLPRVMTAVSESGIGPASAIRTGPGLLAPGERLEHPVGDVQARTAVHRLLQDEVVLLRLRDLPDHAVGPLEERGELLVAPQVQVLAVLALHALEIEAQALQLLLLRAPVALAHGDRFLFQLSLQRLDLRLPPL